MQSGKFIIHVDESLSPSRLDHYFDSNCLVALKLLTINPISIGN